VFPSGESVSLGGLTLLARLGARAEYLHRVRIPRWPVRHKVSVVAHPMALGAWLGRRLLY